MRRAAAKTGTNRRKKQWKQKQQMGNTKRRKQSSIRQQQTRFGGFAATATSLKSNICFDFFLLIFKICLCRFFSFISLTANKVAKRVPQNASVKAVRGWCVGGIVAFVTHKCGIRTTSCRRSVAAASKNDGIGNRWGKNDVHIDWACGWFVESVGNLNMSLAHKSNAHTYIHD